MSIPNQCIVPLVNNVASIYELEGVDFHVALISNGKGIAADSAEKLIGLNKWRPAQPFAQTKLGTNYLCVSAYKVSEKHELWELRVLKRFDSWNEASKVIQDVCDLFNR